MDIKYSVIIPVYNAEKYLDECLNSLKKQSFRECEFIIWNDGSTDNSIKIIEKYSTDERFRMFGDENKGVAIARQCAINMSKGKYILFLDSDDVVSDRLIETIDSMMDDSIDLLEYGSTENIDCLSDNASLKWEVLDKVMFTEKYIKRVLVDGNEGVVLWNKVFVRDILVNCLKDYPYSMLEDYVFIMRYSEHVKSYCRTSKILHFYRYVNNSLSKCINPEWYQILLYVQQLKIEFMERMKLISENDQIHAAAWFIRYTHNFILNNFFLIKKDDIRQVLKSQELAQACKRLSHTEFDNNFAKSVRKKRHKIAINYVFMEAIWRSICSKIKNILLGR